MDLSRYTLRFDTVTGGFSFDPAKATATRLTISIDAKSVSTGDPTFDKRIAHEATFKRSDFGVGQWAPLEADEVTVLVETEFVKS